MVECNGGLFHWNVDCQLSEFAGLSSDFLYGKDTKRISFTEFVNKELVLFSNLDNERSIPCLVDGE